MDSLDSRVVIAQGDTPVGVPAKGIETIAADTDLGTLGYAAIMCNSDMTIYFGTADTVTYTWPADTPFVVHPTEQPKLSAETECLVF